MTLAWVAAGLAALAVTAPAGPEAEPALHPAAQGAQVVCYVETLFGGVRPTGLDLSLCTQVVDAFALVDATGAVRPAAGLPRTELVKLAHAGGAMALLAVGGATVPGKVFTQLSADAAARARFLSELGKLVLAGGYDGVDLDWEFPRPDEREKHLAFVTELRASLDALFTQARGGQHALLSIGLSPGDALEGYDGAGLARLTDTFVLFGYDYRNPALGPWANEAKLWPDGSSRRIEGSVRGAASEYVKRGVPRAKLVVALPMYASDGRPWDAVRAQVLGRKLPLHPLFLESELDGVWVTGPEAMEAKARKLLSSDEIAGGGAAGVALWQLGHQGTHRELTEALRRGLPPGRPLNPGPPDATVLEGAPASLTWDEARGIAEEFAVYAGPSAEAVDRADERSPLYVGRFRNPRAAAPRGLGKGVHFWRVDALGPGGSVHGKVWSFEVRPREK
ncbi:MAG: glycoside hydrolase family 18 protein [Deltaproteobacteria bacterium]|nr:glycoside hydrolase family 18 protein [Deltaproteobacteria bacterium]